MRFGNARSVLLYHELDYDRLVAAETVNGDGPIELLGSYVLNTGH